MTQATALLVTSSRQALRFRRTLMLVLLELAPGVIFLFASANRTAESTFSIAVDITTGTYFALVMPVVAIVVASGVLGNERRDLTLSFIALRPIPRWAIAAAKIGAAIGAAFLINLVGALVLGAAHIVRGGDTEFLVGLIAGALAATACYASVMVPLGFLTDRAVIIGIAYLLVFENGAAWLLTGLGGLSPWRVGMSVFAGVAQDVAIISESAAVPLSLGRAVLTVAIYLAVGLALTMRLLQRRDLA